jgi:hypothetical protein
MEMLEYLLLPQLRSETLALLEQTATGAVACQLLDALHPGSVNLSKVHAEQEMGLACLKVCGGSIG